jgi:hypothetical protein
VLVIALALVLVIIVAALATDFVPEVIEMLVLQADSELPVSGGRDCCFTSNDQLRESRASSIRPHPLLWLVALVVVLAVVLTGE